MAEFDDLRASSLRSRPNAEAARSARARRQFRAAGKDRSGGSCRPSPRRKEQADAAAACAATRLTPSRRSPIPRRAVGRAGRWHADPACCPCASRPDSGHRPRPRGAARAARALGPHLSRRLLGRRLRRRAQHRRDRRCHPLLARDLARRRRRGRSARRLDGPCRRLWRGRAGWIVAGPRARSTPPTEPTKLAATEIVLVHRRRRPAAGRAARPARRLLARGLAGAGDDIAARRAPATTLDRGLGDAARPTPRSPAPSVQPRRPAAARPRPAIRPASRVAWLDLPDGDRRGPRGLAARTRCRRPARAVRADLLTGGAGTGSRPSARRSPSRSMSARTPRPRRRTGSSRRTASSTFPIR